MTASILVDITNVSEENTDSIFRDEETYCMTPERERVGSYETSLYSYQTILRHIPGGSTALTHGCENFEPNVSTPRAGR
jgi:hypothetical protein